VQAIAESTNYNIELNQKGERLYVGINASTSHRKPPKTDARGKFKPWRDMLVTEAEIMKYIALSMHAGKMKMLWAQDYGSKFMVDSGMSYERWQEINEFIHIGLEDGFPNRYKMDKMRKLVVECNKIWLEQVDLWANFCDGRENVSFHMQAFIWSPRVVSPKQTTQKWSAVLCSLLCGL